MIDIEQIRRNPDAFRRAAIIKRIPLELDRLLKIDEQRRKLVNEVDSLRRKRNQISDNIAAGSQNREQQVVASRETGIELKAKEAELQTLESEFAGLMALVPSLPADDVPEGETDADNVELHRWGTVRVTDFKQRDHIELASLHSMVDFEGARLAAGSRAYALTGTSEVGIVSMHADLPEDAQLKVVAAVTRLRSLGHELRRPEGDYLRDKIYELRASLHHIHYRVLYFFYQKRAVLSHGLIKERVVPTKEIDRAIANKLLYERNPDKYTYREISLWV